MFYWLLVISYGIFLVFLSFGIRKPEDSRKYFYLNFLLNGKNLFFTFSASWLGGASLILLSEKAANLGIYSIFIIPLPTILTLILLYLIAGKIKKYDFFYTEEIISKDYGEKFGKFSSFVFIWYLILLGSSQLVALGKVGQSFFKANYPLFIIISAILVIFYSSLKGFGAVVKTDKIQLYLITIGIVFIFILSLKRGNFILSDLVDKEFSPSLILITISFTLAWTVSPISIQRIKATKSMKEIKRGILLSIIFLTFAFFLIIGFGIVCQKGILDIKYSPLSQSIIFILLISALFSTYDTVLNSAAISLKYLTNLSGFSSTILVGVISIIISLKIPSIIKTLGLSSEIIAESLFIPVIFSLISKKKNRIGGRIVILLGFLLSLLSFSTEIFSINIPFRWPYSILFSLPLLILIFMLSFLLGREKGNE